LYARSQRVKILPASSEDYLVHIPNTARTTIDLWLFRLEDVRDCIYNPNPDNIFKRWSVSLSNDTEIKHRVTWFVRSAEDSQENASGTLTLGYVGGTENSVDIYLNSRVGSKLYTLKPGDNAKAVGLDYGIYTIHYRYWFSDQDSPDGIKVLDWIEKEIVNGQEVDIYLILNASRQRRHIQIPHWQGGELPQTQYGNIRIRNSTPEPIQIWTNGQLIENVMYTDQPVDNQSTVAANDIGEYTLPADEYLFIAKDLINATEVAQKGQTIELDSTYYWEVTQ